jgi:hypothetical protein
MIIKISKDFYTRHGKYPEILTSEREERPGFSVLRMAVISDAT